MTQTNIIVKLQVEGFHNWPNAKEVFPDVAFLSDRHRHIFHITCKKEVHHDDRDVEIIRFKREILNYLYSKYQSSTLGWHVYLELGAMSCEMLAKELFNKFNLEYCSVLEDNENGAEIHIRKENF